MKRLFLPFASLVAAGCSFTEIPPPPGSVAVNQCEEDNECSGGRCRNNFCVSLSRGPAPLLLEVTPPTNVADVGGLPFYARLERAAGDIPIGPVGTVTSSIAAPGRSTCRFLGAAPDRATQYEPSVGTIPAGLSFVPTERVLGVAARTYVTATGEGANFQLGVDPYRSTTSLPSGGYDIYIQPDPVPGVVGCKVPPLLVRRQPISGSTALTIELPAPALLPLKVRGPVGDASLVGWSVDVLDSLSGRVLSSAEVLPPPTQGAEFSEYTLSLAFVPAHEVVDGKLRVDPELEGIEVIRLSPPQDVIAPSFLFEREGLRLSDDPLVPATIDLSPPGGYSTSATPLLPNVLVEGQTSVLETGAPVAAAVTLASTTLEGVSTQASFIATFQVDETGTFLAWLPPGTYRVRADPPATLGLSAAETEWVVRPLSVAAMGESVVQAGKTVELPGAPHVIGRAYANGSPVFGATATTVVSPLSVQTTVLQRTLGEPPLLPRTSSDIVARDGRFDVPVDPGRYDFFVRPEERSHFPWLVLPSLNVPEGGVNLDRRKVSLPVVHRGSVLLEGTTNVVPGALIRAYVYVTALGVQTQDVSEASAVVPIAETRADESGAFELLIPASLDSP